MTDQAPVPTSGYSQAVRIGTLVITSGFLGTAPDGSGVVTGGFEAEARQALDNVRAVLAAAGCPLSAVVRVNVSLTDIGRFADMDRIFREYFTPPYPTRNTIGVKELWGGAQIGFDVWAVVE
ncbi:MAG: Rid family hydrolase [Chloroflexaceae bacterium]